MVYITIEKGREVTSVEITAWKKNYPRKRSNQINVCELTKAELKSHLAIVMGKIHSTKKIYISPHIVTPQQTRFLLLKFDRPNYYFGKTMLGTSTGPKVVNQGITRMSDSAIAELSEEVDDESECESEHDPDSDYEC